MFTIGPFGCSCRYWLAYSRVCGRTYACMRDKFCMCKCLCDCMQEVYGLKSTFHWEDSVTMPCELLLDNQLWCHLLLPWMSIPIIKLFCLIWYCIASCTELGLHHKSHYRYLLSWRGFLTWSQVHMKFEVLLKVLNLCIGCVFILSQKRYHCMTIRPWYLLMILHDIMRAQPCHCWS